MTNLERVCCKIGSQRTREQKVRERPFAPAFVCTSCYSVEIARHLDAAKLTLTPRSASNVDDPAVFGVNPKFCVNAKLWCKIEQKYFKAGAAQAAAAFSTKTTALRGNVKGGGVSLRSSRPSTYRCAVGQSGIRSAKNTDNWEWIRLQSCRLPVHFFVIFYASHRFYSFVHILPPFHKNF